MNFIQDALTIAGVYKPLNPIDLNNSVMQNRLAGMAFADEQRRRKDQNALLGMMMQPGAFQNAPNTQVQGNTIAPQGQPQPVNNALAAPSPQGQPQQPRITNALLTTPQTIQQDTGTAQQQPSTFMDRYTASIMNQPSPAMIWQAAREGRISPQGAYEYQQQYAAQMQAAEDKAFADFEAYHKPMMTNAYETGNDELFQASLQAGVSSGIPRVARVAQSMLDANIHISGKGETKAQSVMTPETRSRLLKDAGNDPTTQDAIKSIPDGQSFEVAHKGKRISEIKPIDKNATEEQLTARALRGDKEAQAVLDAMEKRKLKIARENRAIIKQYSSGGHGEHGGGGGAPDFSKWTKEDKKWWFDRSLTNPADKPDFGYGKAAAASRSQYSRELAAYARGKGITGPEAAERKAEFAADQSALRDMTKRKELIGTFTNRIDATSRVVLDIARKYQKTNSRLLNMPLNRLAGFMGSGEYQSLKLALKSLSNEVAKVESGSLGIAEVSVEQAKYMEKVHDADLSINDMKKVVETAQTLGKTSMQSIEQQRRDLTQRMKGGGLGGEQEAPTGKPMKVGKYSVTIVE